MVVDYEIPMAQDTIDGRRSMRSIADAIERLRLEGRLSDHSLAQIRTGPFRLPGGEITSIVLIIGEPRNGEPSCGVALPSSDFFTGRSVGGVSERLEISRLDRAWIDNNGRVKLSDGMCLHAVNVVPTPLPWELTELQKRIVYWTIKFIGAEAKCYLYGPPTPHLEWLDYGRLHKLKLLKLEAIAQYVAENDPQLDASRQTVANALSASGMRRPRSGRLAG